MNRSHAIVLGLILAFIGHGVEASQAESSSEQPQSLQPLIAAPDQHKLRFENQHVRVLEVIVPPGVIVPLHLHDLPSVFITLSPARFRLRNESGVIRREIPRASPPDAEAVVRWLDPSSTPGSVENIDDVTFHGFRIELKAPLEK